ncbi:MAG: DUF4292 domain-containing protein [Bacteroidaceae bacterium]|nr:DUF4292 domain-containing protein [Bacteroidaceae bacterium]
MTKQIKTRKLSILACLILAVALTGCRTNRSAEKQELRLKKQYSEQVLQLAKPQAELTNLTARTAITLDYGMGSVNVKGRLKMRRDEAIQMTITALGLMEVACVEFTPQHIYIIDRINKRYTKVDYASGMLSNIGVNFETIQSLFWNRIFIPGKAETWQHPEDYEIKVSGNQLCVTPARQRMLKSFFYTDEDCRQLQQTLLELSHYGAIWRYDDFDQFDGQELPTTFDISITSSSYAAGAHVALSSISTTDNSWKSGVDLSRYKAVEFDELLSILNTLR